MEAKADCPGFVGIQILCSMSKCLLFAVKDVKYSILCAVPLGVSFL